MTNSRKRGQKEGSLYQRKDGYWVVAISLGNGRRKVAYARTAEEARDKKRDLELALSQGHGAADGRVTVGELMGVWLEAKRNTVRAKTHARYGSLIRRHLPRIAGIKLAKLTVADLASLYRAQSTLVSPKTIRHLHAVLKSGLSWAVRREMIGRNPAASITAEDLPRMVRRQMRVLSVEESRSLLRAAEGHKAQALITFALVTGARIGEATALTWDRLNLQTGRARIDHSLQWFDGKPTFVEPKTRAGIRELVLPAFAVKVLRSHLAKQNEQALRLGRAWSNPLNLVFVSETGNALNRHTVLRQYLRPLLVKAGLPASFRVHDLRHGAASLMLAQGVPVPVVAELLGHSTPAITYSIYSHALPDSQQRVATEMEAVLAGGVL